ncbi:hypothetical protein OKA04_06270 [Luteolibacter flavescens]|uniref:Uncharacterized protein n=1 Tax=Luteolibacter flavescens TaxID=1859460 RepID=A0ABT3FMB1_9BACT|nr:hypothetical protein [Luteolibacter flavescens]MCW1884329.1 hypothetical protein [Luteolibacter flavescens]
MDDLATRIWLADNLPTASSERLEEIAASLLNVPDLDDRAWIGLFSCWFEKAPRAAWAFAAGRSDLRGIALEEWAKLDPGNARESLGPLSPDDLLALFRGAVEKDVLTAFRLLDEASAGDASLLDLSTIASQLERVRIADLASRDPEFASFWVDRLDLRYAEGALLLGRWKNDPAAATEWLGRQEHPADLLGELASFTYYDDYSPALMDFVAGNFPAGNRRMEAIQRMLEQIAYKDPEFAASEASRVIPDDGLRAEAIGKIASLVADTDFDKAWSLLDTLDPSIQGLRRVSLPKIETQPELATGNTVRAFQYGFHLTSMRGLESPGNVRSNLLESLIYTDKDEAIRLMEKIPAKDFHYVGSSAFATWAARDYRDAVLWLAEKRSTGTGGDIGDILDLVQVDAMRQEVPALIESLQPGTVRSALVALHAEDLAESDPLSAIAFAREATTADVGVSRAYATWADHNPLEALEYLKDDDAAPLEAWKSVVRQSFKEAPERTALVISALPSGDARDSAISSVLTLLEDSDPLSSGAWALFITDENSRKARFGSMIEKLTMDLRAAHDPATAEELRQQVEDAAGLSDTERQLWLDRIDLEFPEAR